MSRRWIGLPLPSWRLSRRRGRHHVEDTSAESEASSELETSPMPPKEIGTIQQPMGQQPDGSRAARVAVATSKPAFVEAEPPRASKNPESIQPQVLQQLGDIPRQTGLASKPSSPTVLQAELSCSLDDRESHTQPGNVHGCSKYLHSSILSNAQGTQISNAHFVAATNVIFNPSSSSEGVARGKKIMLDNIASSALYNSQERFDPPKCEENTRVGLLSAIRTWIEDRSSASARLQCITGSAGTGKSALMQTTAEQCEPAGLVAATFFFSASDPVRNNLRHFIPTIAYQIALASTSDPALGNRIFRAVDRDPSIFKRSIERQLQELIVKPLQETFPQGYVELFSSPSFPYLISIDGLDECADRKSQTQLLRIISTTFIDNRLPFKILLASRPERPLQAAILGDSGYMKRKSQVINLNDYDASADIKTFLQTELRTIGQEGDDPRAQTEWPSLEDIDTLVAAAAGLFVYASTVVKFVSQRKRWPRLPLETVLQIIKSSSPTGRVVQVRKHPFAELDALYRNIFAFAQKEYAIQHEDEDDDPLAVIRMVRMLSLPLPWINFAMVYSDPLVAPPGAESIQAGLAYGIGSRNKSVADMEDIFQLEPGHLESMFSDLHSLYAVKWGESDDAILRPYHKSVQDFLLDPTRCGEDLYIPDYLVVGRWTTVILGILAKASDSMLTGSDDDWVSSDSRLDWACFEMAYQVPLPSGFEEDAQWPVIMEEWHHIYKPFTGQGLFSRLACALKGVSTPWSLQYIAHRTFCLVLGFMLYEAPRLAGSEWDPGIRQDMQELFDVINELQLTSGRASKGEFAALGEGDTSIYAAHH
ncbi:hypothetical protein FA15DRAFT_168179 [Coprinopsis marcescibilis]|uniref:Nephrocystin 3-like N-terminal domain-containing protein n=1 Tax=Coprinopsis marcescibilis TaxID=230819 RepID=A0A5C3KI82_COPMA|nr:hypothetical protein FA15DRAFT_168179 [Coprinopsis marcescibilis]